MYQLIETLQIKHGEIQLLPYHQKRMDRSILDIFNITNTINLQESICIPTQALQGIWKCRIVYNKEIKEITFSAYEYKEILTLRIVEDNGIDYHVKYENRSCLQLLLAQKESADDILIIKNGFITDTTFSNIAFFDGNEWITPDSYLLAGTKRAYLLDTNQIKEKPITKESLANYKKARLLNCFYDLDNGNDILMKNIQ